jgi:hypothetical protein
MAGGRPADPAHFFARVLADQHYQKGLQYERLGEWDRALASYRRACAIEPSNVLYLLARGHVCQDHGLDPEADACYSAALRLRPDDTVVLYNQAQLFAARGQLEEARANLARIVAAGVDVLGDRAAPIFCRLGDIAMRREDYATAALHFRRALECDPGHRYATAALGGLPRFQEFSGPFDRAGGIRPKIAFYGYAGAMLLGMPEDDGISIPAYPGLGFDSLAELAQTMARFTSLAQRLGWHFDAVTPLDAESQPLAIALAVALGAQPIADLERVPREACTLAVVGTAGDPAPLEGRALTLRGRCPRSLLYALGVAQPVWQYNPFIQVANAPSRLEFPWNRGEASAREHAEAFGFELSELLKGAADDGTAVAQLAWYGPPAGHTRLSFDVHTLELVGSNTEAVAGR